jgi:hypothetical protein
MRASLGRMRLNQDTRLHSACSSPQSPGQDSAIQSTIRGTNLAKLHRERSQSHPKYLTFDQLRPRRRGANVRAQTCIMSTPRLRTGFVCYEKASDFNVMHKDTLAARKILTRGAHATDLAYPRRVSRAEETGQTCHDIRYRNEWTRSLRLTTRHLRSRMVLWHSGT